MTHNMLRRIAAATAAGAVLLSLTACTGNDDPKPTKNPTTTAIPTAPTTAPDERPGSEYALKTVGYTWMSIEVFEMTRYTASAGCGCSTEDGGPEIFPAGSQAILLRVTFEGLPAISQKGRGTWNVPDLKMTAVMEGWDGQAVLEEHEGPKRAEKAGLPWLPEGLFPKGSGTIQNGVPTSFVAAYYVPDDVQTLTLTLTGWQDPTETGHKPEPLVLEVPIEQVQLQ